MRDLGFSLEQGPRSGLVRHFGVVSVMLSCFLSMPDRHQKKRGCLPSPSLLPPTPGWPPGNGLVSLSSGGRWGLIHYPYHLNAFTWAEPAVVGVSLDTPDCDSTHRHQSVILCGNQALFTCSSSPSRCDMKGFIVFVEIQGH